MAWTRCWSRSPRFEPSAIRQRAIGAGDRANGLDMREEEEDPRHQVDDIVAPDRHAARAQEAHHRVEDDDHQHHLQDVQQQPDDRVAVSLADLVDAGVKDQLEGANHRSEYRFRSFDLKHA